MEALARETGTSKRTAYRRTAENPGLGIYPDLANGTAREHEPGDLSRILELREAGLSMRAIATEIGRSVGYVHKMIQQATET